jgi:16S rRNA (cytosine1402-N4)-methyltransferase
MVESFPHETVLRQETVAAVIPDNIELQQLENNEAELIVVDCTLGGAGHASCLLEMIASQGFLERGGRMRLIGIDRDATARAAAQGRLRPWFDHPRIAIEIVAQSFAHTAQVLEELHLMGRVHGLYADFGVSSPQLDVAQRGFSLRLDGPLDMRMDTAQQLTARDILIEWNERDLARLFRDFGEEPKAGKLAHAIVLDRAKGGLPLDSTIQFAGYVERVLGYRGSRTPPATRIFQALRIAVNDELGEIVALLDATPEILSPQAKAAFISFHSLEDRLVKQSMRAWERGLPKHDQAAEDNAPIFPHLERPCWGRELPRGGVVPARCEVDRNPRAHSARLRVFCFNGKNRRQ